MQEQVTKTKKAFHRIMYYSEGKDEDVSTSYVAGAVGGITGTGTLFSYDLRTS